MSLDGSAPCQSPFCLPSWFNKIYKCFYWNIVELQYCVCFGYLESSPLWILGGSWGFWLPLTLLPVASPLYLPSSLWWIFCFPKSHCSNGLLVQGSPNKVPTHRPCTTAPAHPEGISRHQLVWSLPWSLVNRTIREFERRALYHLYLTIFCGVLRCLQLQGTRKGTDTIPVCVRAATTTEASAVLATCFVKWLNDLMAAAAAAAAAKSLQSCPAPCDPIDGSPPGSSVSGILQARTLGWVAISFSNAGKWKVILFIEYILSTSYFSGIFSTNCHSSLVMWVGVLVSKVHMRPTKLREVNHLFEVSQLNFKNRLTPKHFRWMDNQMNEGINDGRNDSMKTLVIRLESRIRVWHSDSQSRLPTESTVEI